MIKVSAPGKIILFGEHAVVYDKLGIACTIGKRCLVKISPFLKEGILIESKNFKIKKFISKKKLFEFFQLLKNLKKEKKFEKIKEIYKRDKLSPTLFVLGNIFQKYGFKNLKIEINSEIPKNLGSSSALFSALSFGVLKFLGRKPTKKEVSDFAFEGDIIAHGGTPSGIDNATCTYGGYLIYKKSKGIKPLKIDFKIPLLIVDSKRKSKTAQTVSFIRIQKKENPKFVNFVLNNLDTISKEALKSLKSKNLKNLGQLMFDYYQELRKLKISTRQLDKTIEIARKNGALGAKPTGGWGGGCCLVLAKNQKEILNLKREFAKNGFPSFQTKIGVEGVKLIS
jgi:mevalonate kinase